jgi:hypothetical protein
MAFEHVILPFSWPAGADLSGKQYYAVQLTTSETVTLADATVRVLGILQNDPASGDAASVALAGISRAVTDGSGTAIAAMDALAPDANGKLVKTTTDNDETVATALQASTTDGAIIAVLVHPLRRY